MKKILHLSYAIEAGGELSTFLYSGLHPSECRISFGNFVLRKNEFPLLPSLIECHCKVFLVFSGFGETVLPIKGIVKKFSFFF